MSHADREGQCFIVKASIVVLIFHTTMEAFTKFVTGSQKMLEDILRFNLRQF